MDRSTVAERSSVSAPSDADREAIEFVRFCHRRRRVGWPELYDEMCAVAGRGLYRGFGQDDLAAIGIGFGLFQMPALAGLVARVVAEDLERRRLTAAALAATLGDDHERADVVVSADATDTLPEPAGATAARIRLAVAAGA